jgi:hypothetical protein
MPLPIKARNFQQFRPDRRLPPVIFVTGLLRLCCKIPV